MKATNKLFLASLALAAVGRIWAQTEHGTKPATKKKHVTAPAQPAVTAADVQSLKDAIAAQQQQIQQLTQQLQQNQQAWQQAQQQVAAGANHRDRCAAKSCFHSGDHRAGTIHRH